MIEVKVSRKIFNSVYLPYLDNKKRYEIIYGGAGSGKSVFVAQKKVLQHLDGKHKTLVVRKVARTSRNSTFSLIKDIISEWNCNNLFKINKSDMEIINLKNGNQFIFSGLDDVEKLKSITGITDIWVEEASEITQEDFQQLDLRMRGKTRQTKQITMTFNPISALSWIKGYFFDVKRDDTTILKTTYKDNKFIDKEYINVLEGLKEQDHVYYQIYALGEWGVLGNLVFTNYVVEDIPTEYKTIYQGLDFGFNDPSAFIKIGLKDDELYVFDELYVRGLTNNELIPLVREKADRSPIIADSSEPDRIKEFKQNGLNVRAAEKGPGSIKAGLDWAKRKRIHIHPDCTNFIKEIQGYKYREDKDGNVYDEPVDMNNHLMDALRYALEPLHKDRKLASISKKALGL